MLFQSVNLLSQGGRLRVRLKVQEVIPEDEGKLVAGLRLIRAHNPCLLGQLAGLSLMKRYLLL